MTVFKEEDFTEQFDGNLFVPGSVGVYKTIHPISYKNPGFQYWNGSYWGYRVITLKYASVTSDYTGLGYESSYQNLPFQGLKVKYE
jgi:hypothetical protein